MTFSENVTILDSTTVLDLWYYDGLARQESMIKLTIDQGVGEGQGGGDGRQLVSPIEHCLRTKWTDASVGWNGADPIL